MALLRGVNKFLLTKKCCVFKKLKLGLPKNEFYFSVTKSQDFHQKNSSKNKNYFL
jgi:hypothetical protein